MSKFYAYPKSAADFDTLLIFGAGGSGREIAWLAEQIWGGKVEMIHVVDKSEYLSPDVNGIPVKILSEVEPEGRSRFVVALGDPSSRRRMAAACIGFKFSPVTLINPRVEMSRSVEVGCGCVISAGCVITTNVVIGDHVHVNVGCTISHDVRIGEFTTLSPGVHVAGHVHIGKNVFIGTGANIINGSAGKPLFIGDNAIVAAGACVTKSVDTGSLVAGVPATRKR